MSLRLQRKAISFPAQRNPGRALFLTALLVAVLTGLWVVASGPRSTVQAAGGRRTLANPDQRCATCHADIYRRYEGSAMARGSGLAADGFIAGETLHANSGVGYKVFRRDGESWMSYHRDAQEKMPSLDGERKLEYFVGSGKKGRTFLYQQEGYWYELPINYYARKGGWEMAPNYSQATSMPAPLPTDGNCLHCHATDIGVPRLNAQNDFGAAPFQQGGVGCTACHGDPSAHLAQNGHGPIINPSKLSASKRDSTCLQCHLEGNAVVYKPGRSLASFKADEELNDTAVYFVYASQAMGGSRATSQYEALLQSACKRASGDKLTCTTCHNPHGDPPAAERVQYFRARCLSCHTNPVIATKHHPEQPDCARCHMPTRDTSDISHEQVTDHNIQRVPATQVVGRFLAGEELVPVGVLKVGDRELGLAYAQLAQQGDRKAGERALALLARVRAADSDEQVHLNLGFLQQVSGNVSGARSEYTAALTQNPFDTSALSNLALIDARGGNVAAALALLQRAVDADPARTAAGLNLAFLQCKQGRVGEARDVVARLRKLNPDSPDITRFLQSGSYGGQRCAAIGTESPPTPTLRSLP